MNQPLNERSRHFAVFFWIGFVIVIFVNILVWLYVRQVETSFENQLRARLKDDNRLIARLIYEYNNDLPLARVIPGERNSLAYLFYQQPLEEIRVQSGLQSILLVSPQGDILAASPEQIAGQATSSLAEDPLFRAALKGNTAVSGIEEFAGEKFMSAYTPVVNVDGFVIAVLISEVKADYFLVLTQLKNRIFLFSALSLLIILITALLLFRMIRRSMRYQAAIKDQEHLVQLGTMASTVAHELRNPLGIIEGTNDLIKKKYGDHQDELFEYIPLEIRRLNGLIDDLLKFARQPKINPRLVNLRQLLERIKLSFAPAERQRLAMEIPDQPATFSTDPDLLEQILLNLLRNAIQATANGGEVALNVASPGKKSVQIEIRDSGNGIPEDQLNNIFKPFFTTREKGSGLGLAISKRLVEALNGEISIRSRVGEGTTVTIRLREMTTREKSK